MPMKFLVPGRGGDFGGGEVDRSANLFSWAEGFFGILSPSSEFGLFSFESLQKLVLNLHARPRKVFLSTLLLLSLWPHLFHI